MRTVNPEEFRALESLIDACGLSNVLWTMHAIAYAKAEHILSNWQDADSARAWEWAAAPLKHAAEHGHVQLVSR